MHARLFAAALFLAAPIPALAENAPPPSAPAAPAAKPAIRAAGPRLVEPHLHIEKSKDPKRPRVALTFDACMGQTDKRILYTLLEKRIPATIFVTARWLKHNPDTVKVFLANPDLFELEDHGENHIPAIDYATTVYGIATAGSPVAVGREVAGGADAMKAAGIETAPRWFRGATAKYDLSAIREIRAMGYRVAGYSVNGDDGSLLGAAGVEKRYAAVKDGDVIISHINQPTHAAGDGIAKAILALKARGVDFVRLSDVDATGDFETTTQAKPTF
jgi:peptidoglycan/xylan/chitin deacetylase (PgdA/CDA1 family)